MRTDGYIQSGEEEEDGVMKTTHLQNNKIFTTKNEIFEVVLICMI